MNTFSIVNVYKTNDKETLEEIFVVQAVLQASFPVSYQNSFKFTPDEFKKIFWPLINEEKYALWLVWVLLQAKVIKSYSDFAVVDKVSSKKS